MHFAYTLALLFTAALLPTGTNAYEPNPDNIPLHVRRFFYCSRLNGTGNARIPNQWNPREIADAPFRLVLYNATYVPSNLTNVVNNVFYNLSETPIETIEINPGGAGVGGGRNGVDFTIPWEFTLNVPYGNYINAHIVDSNGGMLVQNAIYGLWVDKGQGTCNQSALNSIPYDPASMASGALTSVHAPAQTLALIFGLLVGAYALV